MHHHRVFETFQVERRAIGHVQRVQLKGGHYYATLKISMPPHHQCTSTANSHQPPHPATATSTSPSREKSPFAQLRTIPQTQNVLTICSRRKITFIDKDSVSHTFIVADGANLLDIAQAHDLEMEGACGGSCACSTCHVIVEDEAMYDKMEEPDDDENDMLDLAFGLTETSRLGCQVVMRKELDGLVVRLPRITRNLQASDFESK
jgi:ferredoxin